MLICISRFKQVYAGININGNIHCTTYVIPKKKGRIEGEWRHIYNNKYNSIRSMYLKK